MFLYTICRLGFFYFNYELFPAITLPKMVHIMLGGLRFDLSAILYLNIPFIILSLLPSFQKKYKNKIFYLFMSTNSLGIGANCFDFIYYPFILKRTSYSIFETFSNETNLLVLFSKFLLDFWYAFLIWILLCLLLALLYKLVKTEAKKFWHPKIQTSFNISAILICIILSIFGIRGGFDRTTRPISLSNAGRYVDQPKEIALVLNTPFSIIRTINKPGLKRLHYFNKQEAMRIINPIHTPPQDSVFTPKNVVIFILESFSKEFIGAYNPDSVSYTPFLDTLIPKGASFFSLANGHKSIEAIPSIIMSIPSWETPFVLSEYSTNKIQSLPKLLKNKGYYSSFFHGAPNGSMGFQALATIGGFDTYFGKTEYNNDADFDGYWGIWDEEFFQFFAKKLEESPQPFISVLFSVSSHHPYPIPAKHKHKFPAGKLPIHRSIRYTDYALKKFFAKAAKMPWFNNTLFVITADHCNALTAIPKYASDLGLFEIPLLFYYPQDSSLAAYYPRIGQQIDILPTVLAYLNYDKKFLSFGRNLLDSKQQHYAINYLGGAYQLTKGNYFLQFDTIKSLGLYNYKKDPLLQHNLIYRRPKIQRNMEKFLQSFLQQFNQRMLDDQMHLETEKLNLSKAAQNE